MVSEQHFCDSGKALWQKAIRAGFSEQLLTAIEQSMTAAFERSTALFVNEMNRVSDSYIRRSEARRGEEDCNSRVDELITPRGGLRDGRSGGFGNGGGEDPDLGVFDTITVLIHRHTSKFPTPAPLSSPTPMGTNHSREDLDLFDSKSKSKSQETTKQESDYEDAYGTPSHPSDQKGDDPKTPSSIDEVESRLKALKLKYNSKSSNPNLKNVVKLYHHVGGNTAKSKWGVSEKLVSYSFVKKASDDEEDDEYETGEGSDPNSRWVLKIGSKAKANVDENLQFKAFKEQMRVDFILNGVWAIKFFSAEEWNCFTKRYQDCLFENTYGYEANDDSKLKVYGKDFMGWANPEAADDSMWEDVDMKTPPTKTPKRSHDLTKEFEEASANGGAIQSLALGALDNSFLVSDSGIQVVRNYSHGIQGKGIYVNIEDGMMSRKKAANGVQNTPRKALLMRAETNMLLMSPMNDAKPHSRGLHQFDIETGKVVTEWKFEKDGTDISMRDITNDSKGAQMDPSGSTFLGLDDNRLCHWDMRDYRGMVQNIVNESTPVLNWTLGHQFSRETNFQCFATTGDGSIVIGSLDGKIRLYSVSSIRQAKTAFPGLGSPITHVDVTFDGNRISVPRLLKLSPVDSHMAGATKFRNAQFSWVTENRRQERHLVATSITVSVGSNLSYRILFVAVQDATNNFDKSCAIEVDKLETVICQVAVLASSNIRVLGTRLFKEGSIVMTRSKDGRELGGPVDKSGIG